MITIEESAMPSNRSLELAAQAWCTETTSNRIMDSNLAVAFAEILDKALEERTHHILGFYCTPNSLTKEIRDLK